MSTTTQPGVQISAQSAGASDSTTIIAADERTYRIEDTSIEGPHGVVPLRLYLPEQPLGIGLVWIHGGAFKWGDLDVPEADWVSRRLAAAGISTVSVDYRLATGGVHFPVPSDDVLAAWRWASTGQRLGIGAGSWHIGGGSAGGNLAASISLQARDGLAVLPASSVLVYPVLHSTLPTPSPELTAKLAQLPAQARFSAETSRELNVNYVGEESLLEHPYAFPAHAEHAQPDGLSGLPPTLIVNSDVDDLRPSGQAYAAALIGAGVDVSVVREVGVRHGHLNEPDNAGAQRTVRRIITWLSCPDARGRAHTDDTAAPAS